MTSLRLGADGTPRAPVSARQTTGTLLDEGTYLASERTMYRILAASGEVHERRDQRRHPGYARPELLASGPARPAAAKSRRRAP